MFQRAGCLCEEESRDSLGNEIEEDWMITEAVRKFEKMCREEDDGGRPVRPSGQE